MLFYGLQGAQGQAAMPGLLGAGLGDATDCADSNSTFSDCLSCCDSNFNSISDPDDYNACTAACNTGFPASIASSTACGRAGQQPCPNGGSGGSSGSSPSGSSTSAQPWYASIFGAVAQGVTTGLKTPTGVPVVAPPWYTTPTGMGAIAVVLIGLAVFLSRD